MSVGRFSAKTSLFGVHEAEKMTRKTAEYLQRRLGLIHLSAVLLLVSRTAVFVWSRNAPPQERGEALRDQTKRLFSWLLTCYWNL